MCQMWSRKLFLTAAVICCQLVPTACDDPDAVTSKDVFTGYDDEADWGATCSNGDFEGMQGPEEMDILQVGVKPLYPAGEDEFDEDSSGKGADIHIKFNGNNQAFLEAADHDLKPSVVVQIRMKDGEYYEAFLQDDCTWKVVDNKKMVRISYGSSGTTLMVYFPEIPTDDIASVTVGSQHYNVLGETYCDEAVAMNDC